MEASKVSEVRRIHIVYFLSLMGRSQEPHLIRLHHLALNGVYLRGTLILFEEKDSILNEEIPVQVHDTEGKQLKQKQPLIPAEEPQLERIPYFKTNSLYQLPLADNESEDCKVELDKLGKHNHIKENSKTDTPETSFSISLSSSSSSLSLSPLKGTSKRFSIGASGLIRNLITCGALDTNDDVTVMLDQAHKTVLSKNSITLDGDDDSATIRKHDRFGGSARNLETCWNPRQHDADRGKKSRTNFEQKGR